mgnify:CR=1 FL=1
MIYVNGDILAVSVFVASSGHVCVICVSDKSLVIVVSLSLGTADLYVAFSYIGSNSYEFMVPYLVMAVIYIALVLLISLGIKCMERSLRKSDRRN